MSDCNPPTIAMKRIDFTRCLKLEIVNLLNISSHLDLQLFQCPAWDWTFRGELFQWSQGPVCYKIDDKQNNCQNREGMEYVLSQFWSKKFECQCDIYCSTFDDCCGDFEAFDVQHLTQHNPYHDFIKTLNAKHSSETMIERMSNQIPPWNRTNPLGYFMMKGLSGQIHPYGKSLSTNNS